MAEAVTPGLSARNEQGLEGITGTRHRKFTVKSDGLTFLDTTSPQSFIELL